MQRRARGRTPTAAASSPTTPTTAAPTRSLQLQQPQQQPPPQFTSQAEDRSMLLDLARYSLAVLEEVEAPSVMIQQARDETRAQLAKMEALAVQEQANLAAAAAGNNSGNNNISSSNNTPPRRRIAFRRKPLRSTASASACDCLEEVLSMLCRTCCTAILRRMHATHGRNNTKAQACGHDITYFIESLIHRDSADGGDSSSDAEAAHSRHASSNFSRESSSEEQTQQQHHPQQQQQQSSQPPQVDLNDAFEWPPSSSTTDPNQQQNPQPPSSSSSHQQPLRRTAGDGPRRLRRAVGRSAASNSSVSLASMSSSTSAARLLTAEPRARAASPGADGGADDSSMPQTPLSPSAQTTASRSDDILGTLMPADGDDCPASPPPMPTDSEEETTARVRHRWASSMREWEIPYKELRIEQRIGAGSYGVVYKGQWHGKVAVKRLKVLNPTDAQLESFRNEVALLRKTRHANVLLFMGACTSLPNLAIVTRWCDGKSLFHHLHVADTRFPILQCIDIAAHIAQGMEYLHAKDILHRDLKSGNILLTDVNTNSPHPYIADFGLATMRGFCSDNTGPTGSILWMAPEVIARRPGSDSFLPCSDVYSFGIVLFEIFSSKLPYVGRPAQQIMFLVGRNMLRPDLNDLRPDCPLQGHRVILQCLRKEINERPTFRELVAVLDGMKRVTPTLQRSGSDTVIQSVERSRQSVAQVWVPRPLSIRRRESGERLAAGPSHLSNMASGDDLQATATLEAPRSQPAKSSNSSGGGGAGGSNAGSGKAGNPRLSVRRASLSAISNTSNGQSVRSSIHDREAGSSPFDPPPEPQTTDSEDLLADEESAMQGNNPDELIV
eukprot:m.205065 g.205065  ORF g.205065 m.205065 type:complete len:839 (-) comp17754_c4_seq1:286-2802(-)